MPQGYYAIEQFKAPKRGAQPEWTAIAHLPFGLSLTSAEKAVQDLGTPGLFRLVQMQRVIWAEKQDGALRLRKSHASSPANLQTIEQMFDRTAGVYPLEEVQAARRQQEKKQSRNK